MIVYLMIRY